MDEQISAAAMNGVPNGDKPTATDNLNADKPRGTLRVGEKGFTVILLAVACFFLYQSILLWINKPGVDGPAIIPLISSGAVVLLTLLEVIRNLRKRTVIAKGIGIRAMAKQVRAYLLPTNVLVAVAAIIGYCALLVLGVSFYIVTPVFLWGLMTFYSKGNYLKNLLWTAICMVFILLVFRLLFNIMMP